MDFTNMIDTIYDQLEDSTSNKLVLPNPVIEISTTNTYWKNIKKILQTINRPPDHFVDYMNKEIGNVNWLSSSKSDGLVIIGKYKPAKINGLLYNYVKQYVICNICNSYNTTISKNKHIKGYQLYCKKCLSQYNI
tara:strand:+ start:202 stop:606 length:405 start_codon:yes stop_codon:yes gene_type:complete